MAYLLVLKYVALIGFAVSDSAILKRPPDVSSCVGENVTIVWEYGNPADILIASWTFDNGTLYDIVRKVTTSSPAVQPSSPLNVEFIENGTIKLIDTLSSYTGTYDLSLSYRTLSPDSDSVDITINDVPESLVFTENATTYTFTCSGSSSIPKVIRVSTSDGTFRYEASPYTSSVTTEGIECCYNGSAASCSTETFTATYDGTIYCQTVRDAPTTVPPTLSTTTQMIQNTTGTQTTTSVPTTTTPTSSTSTSTSTSTQSTTELVTDTQPISTTIVVPLAVGLSLGGTVILVVVIVAVVCCMRRQRNKLKRNPSASVSTSANHMRSGTEQYRITNRRPQTAGPLGRATPDKQDRRQYIPSTNYYHEPEFTYAHGRQHGNRSSGDRGNVRQASEDHRKPHARRHHGSEAGVRRNPMYIEDMRPASVDRGAVDVLQHNYIGNSVRYTPQFSHGYNYF